MRLRLYWYAEVFSDLGEELRAGGRTEAELRWRERERERTSRSTFTLSSFIVRW